MKVVISVRVEYNSKEYKCEQLSPMKTELPNTKNIVVWPKGSVLDSKRPRKSKQDYAATGAESVSFLSSFDIGSWWNEKYDFSLFFFIGSAIWVWLLRAALRWLKFPVHRHTREVYLFYIAPIVVLFLLLYTFDFVFAIRGKKFVGVDSVPTPSTKKTRSNSLGSLVDSNSEEEANN